LKRLQKCEPLNKVRHNISSVLQIKCDQYWPNRGTETYGVMHVTLVDVIELATYTIRTFLVTRVKMFSLIVFKLLRLYFSRSVKRYSK
jgi:hypothetical protein